MTDEPNRSEQRKEEVLKALIMSALDLWPPNQRAPVFARVSGLLMERLSKRDTQRVRTVPREDPL